MVSRRNLGWVIAMIAIVLSLGSIANVNAWDGGVATEGGCCAVPPELRSRARLLEQSFARTDRDDLARQSWARELCRTHPCGSEVTEEQARELMRDYFARLQRTEDAARDAGSLMVAWVSAGIAALSALIALFAIWHAHRSKRRDDPLRASAGG